MELESYVWLLDLELLWVANEVLEIEWSDSTILIWESIEFQSAIDETWMRWSNWIKKMEEIVEVWLSNEILGYMNQAN